MKIASAPSQAISSREDPARKQKGNATGLVPLSTVLSTPGPVLDLTDDGRLIDHVVEGALMVQSAMESLEAFPQDLPNRLTHAILAHHGALERGSPVVPKTLEALAVHHADWLDGSIRDFLDAVESQPTSEGGWTGYSKMFGTQLYPGPAEAPEEPDEEEEISS